MQLFKLNTLEGSKFWVVFTPTENEWGAHIGLVKLTGKSVVTNETLDLRGFGFIPSVGSGVKVSKGTLSQGDDKENPALFETIINVREFPIELIEKINESNKTGS